MLSEDKIDDADVAELARGLVGWGGVGEIVLPVHRRWRGFFSSRETAHE